VKLLLAQKFDRDPSAGHAGKRLRSMLGEAVYQQW
jgi:hypothetical protein